MTFCKVINPNSLQKYRKRAKQPNVSLLFCIPFAKKSLPQILGLKDFHRLLQVTHLQSGSIEQQAEKDKHTKTQAKQA